MSRLDDISGSSADIEPPPPRFSARRFFIIAVLFILAAPVFWQRTQSNPESVAAAYENSDLYQSIYPSIHYGFGRMRAGELPLWNSKQLCGTPFLANPQAGVFQPLNAVFLLPISTERAMALHSFVCLALMGLFFVLYARSLEISYVAACIGAVAYAFCGASAAALSRPALINAMTWAPLFLWMLREGMRSPGFGRIVPAGIVAGALLMSGAPALSLFIFGLGVGYGVFLGIWRAPRNTDLRRAFEKLALMMVIATLVSAVHWAPALAWAVNLDRPFETLFALRLPGEAPSSLRGLFSQIILAKPGPTPRLGYVGPLALLGIPAALVHFRMRRHVMFFLFASIALFIVGASASSEIPVAFPYASALFPAMFCVAMLAAIGFDRILMSSRIPHMPHVGAPTLLTVPFAVFLFYLATAEPRGRIVIFALLMAPVLLFRVRSISAVCGAVLAAILFADLATASLTLYRHPFEDAPACFQHYQKSINTAEEQALGTRVLVSAQPLDFGLPMNLAMIVPTLHDINGQEPLTRDQVVWWRRLAPGATALADFQGTQVAPEASAPALLNFMSARVVMAAPGSPMYAGAWKQTGPLLREMKTEDAVRLFINDKALQRCIWAPSWKMIEGTASAADALTSPEFDATRECLIDRDSKGYAKLLETFPARGAQEPLPAAQLSADASCTFTEDAPERVVLKVNAPDKGVTILADSYDSGWRASLDGKPCPILKANGIFRGVATPPGTHEIAFTYCPLSYIVGIGFSLCSLILLVLAGIVAVLITPAKPKPVKGYSISWTPKPSRGSK